MSNAAEGRRKKRRLRIAQCVPLLLALALPASAQASWTAPVNISDPGRDAEFPEVAADQSGNAVFVWKRRAANTDCGGQASCFRIQARVRSAAGVLSAIQTLASPAVVADLFGGPQVAIDQSGNAVFVWQSYDGTTDCGGFPGCRRVQSRARSAAGSLGTPQTLSDGGQHAELPDAGVDQSGNAVFTWRRRDDDMACGPGCFRVQARSRSATGALSSVQTLSPAGQDADHPHIAVDPNGNSVFVWQRPDGTTECPFAGCSRVQARARSAAGMLSVVQTLSAAGHNATDPHLGIDQSGNAVFAWVRYDGSAYCDPDQGCPRAQARARSATGSLSAVQTLSDPLRGALFPRVAVDQGGNALFAWSRKDAATACGGSGCFRVQARARSATGVLSAVQVFSDPGQSAWYPEVAVDPNSNAVAVWQRRDGTTDCASPGCWRVQGRARSAAGTLSVVQDLSAAGQNANYPQLDVDSNGNAIAVWQRFDGTNWRIQAAAGP
jgi:hypothetical protein